MDRGHHLSNPRRRTSVTWRGHHEQFVFHSRSAVASAKKSSNGYSVDPSKAIPTTHEKVVPAVVTSPSAHCTAESKVFMALRKAESIEDLPTLTAPEMQKLLENASELSDMADSQQIVNFFTVFTAGGGAECIGETAVACLLAEVKALQARTEAVYAEEDHLRAESNKMKDALGLTEADVHTAHVILRRKSKELRQEQTRNSIHECSRIESATVEHGDEGVADHVSCEKKEEEMLSMEEEDGATKSISPLPPKGSQAAMLLLSSVARGQPAAFARALRKAPVVTHAASRGATSGSLAGKDWVAVDKQRKEPLSSVLPVTLDDLVVMVRALKFASSTHALRHDFVDLFVSLGGNMDKTGAVPSESLEAALREFCRDSTPLDQFCGNSRDHAVDVEEYHHLSPSRHQQQKHHPQGPLLLQEKQRRQSVLSRQEFAQATKRDAQGLRDELEHRLIDKASLPPSGKMIDFRSFVRCMLALLTPEREKRELDRLKRIASKNKRMTKEEMYEERQQQKQDEDDLVAESSMKLNPKSLLDRDEEEGPGQASISSSGHFMHTETSIDNITGEPRRKSLKSITRRLIAGMQSTKFVESLHGDITERHMLQRILDRHQAKVRRAINPHVIMAMTQKPTKTVKVVMTDGEVKEPRVIVQSNSEALREEDLLSENADERESGDEYSSNDSEIGSQPAKKNAEESYLDEPLSMQEPTHGRHTVISINNNNGSRCSPDARLSSAAQQRTKRIGVHTQHSKAAGYPDCVRRDNEKKKREMEELGVKQHAPLDELLEWSSPLAVKRRGRQKDEVDSNNIHCSQEDDLVREIAKAQRAMQQDKRMMEEKLRESARAAKGTLIRREQQRADSYHHKAESRLSRLRCHQVLAKLKKLDGANNGNVVSSTQSRGDFSKFELNTKRQHFTKVGNHELVVFSDFTTPFEMETYEACSIPELIRQVEQSLPVMKPPQRYICDVLYEPQVQTSGGGRKALGKFIPIPYVDALTPFCRVKIVTAVIKKRKGEKISTRRQ